MKNVFAILAVALSATSVLAAPTEKRTACPDKAAAAKYASYGDYKDAKLPHEYTSYGHYRREAEAEAAPVAQPEAEAANAPKAQTYSTYGSYKETKQPENYGKYSNYGDYKNAALPHEYKSYGHYRREEAAVEEAQ
ncbi:unnamed protein product [Zymoseptoria tritici ST99CH_3D1]|uniref:Uncharacterized protein n=1 Tax=Zymoseptoria tritici ST99CH_1E4 TaxID=1276532 RepID=A0A2H1H515_ZYMTR|nr:unnamed protein product [Zymoseptoria tritici ST99CH_1E4]SMR64021.1 unnamed protein product [Zymoseptoria tritici ST99CH_3D1]